MRTELTDKRKMPASSFVRFFQYALIPLFKLIEFVVVDKKNVSLRKSDTDKDTTYVIAANHRGYLDAFLICYALSFRVHWQLGPYRFFLKNSFLNNFALRWLLLAFGCFPAKEHQNLPYGLKYALRLTENGETVAIFPEGKISRKDREFEPRRGVSVMSKVENTQVIPARVDWDKSKGIFRSYRIAVGKPFNASEMSPKEVMDIVYDLEFDKKK